MWKVTLRDIRENFGRFLMTVLAVAIGVAFLAGTLSIRDVMASTFSSLTESTTEDMTIQGEVVSESQWGDSTKPITESDVASVRNIDDVKVAYPAYQMMQPAYKKDGPALSIMGAPSLEFNFTPEVDDAKLSEGRAPERGEVVMELSTATRNDVSLGDEIVIYFDKPQFYTVSGIAEFGSGMAGASILLMNEAEVVDHTGEAASAVLVQLDDGADPDTVKKAIEADLGPNYTVKTGEEVKAETDEMIGSILNIVNTFLLVFVALALAISTFIISNTFTISVRQRQKQFALLRAMGASPRQVFSVVLLQALVIGIIGSLIGVLFGQLLITGIRALIENSGMPLSGSMAITARTALISVVIGVVVTIIATIIPSRKAALTPPIEAMRDSGGSQEKPLKVRGLIGAVLLIVGLAATWFGANGGNGTVFGLGAGMLFVSVIVVMPVLIGPLSRVIGWPAQKIAPATGTLAVRSLNASPRKTATTTVAFAIGVALVTAGATVASSITEAMDKVVDEDFNFELGLYTNAGVTDAAPTLELVKGVDGVADAYAMSRIGGAIVDPQGASASALVAVTDPRAFDALGTVFLEGGPEAIDAGEAIVLESFAASVGKGMGDDLTLVGDGAPVTVTIGAITQDTTIVLGGEQIIVDKQAFDDVKPLMTAYYNMIIEPADGADHQQLKDDVQAAVADQYVWTLMDKDSLKGLAASQVNMTLSMLYMLLGLSVVISVLGIINTLTLSVVDRIREIGLLRAVGMQRVGVRRMITVESMVTTAIGLIVGVALGLVVGLALVCYMASDQEATYVIPWATLLVMVVVSVIVGLAAAILPARKAARMDVLDAIATE